MYKLVFIGGGHSNLVAIEKLRKHSSESLEVTLISDISKAPYSGMLCGFLAGIYKESELTIDLHHFAEKFRVRLILAKLVSVDPIRKIIELSDGKRISYDCLSINIGILPTRIPCSEENEERLVYVKPLSHFIPKWNSILENKKNLKVSVVGGGSAGFEVTHALRLRGFAAIHLVTSSQDLLPELDRSTREEAKETFAGTNVQLHFNSVALSFEGGALHLSNNKVIPSDYVFMCTGAEAQRIKGLETDSAGFLLTDTRLRVKGYETIFVAGDCINFNNQGLPKAGVYAVREGEVLAWNLVSSLQGKNLVDFKPQKTFLKIHLTGQKQALASKGRFHFRGSLMWILKNHLDRRFMKRFTSQA